MGTIPGAGTARLAGRRRRRGFAAGVLSAATAMTAVGVVPSGAIAVGRPDAPRHALPSACDVTVASIDPAGGYVERAVDLLNGTSKVWFTQPGVFAPGSVTALSNFARIPFDVAEGAGGGVWRNLTAVSGGRLVTKQIEESQGYPGKPDGVRVAPLTSVRGWGAFSDLVVSYSTKTRSDGSVAGVRGRLYGLTTAGVLYRFVDREGVAGPGPVWRSTGKAAGFGAVRSITLIGQNATSDVLLANTTTGSLLTIRVPVSGAMRTTATRLRDRGWNGLEHLVADDCNERDTVPSTALVGIDADTGAAYGYRLGFARGRRTTITPVGRVGSGWKDAAYANQWFTLGVQRMRGA